MRRVESVTVNFTVSSDTSSLNESSVGSGLVLQHQSADSSLVTGAVLAGALYAVDGTLLVPVRFSVASSGFGESQVNLTVGGGSILPISASTIVKILADPRPTIASLDDRSMKATTVAGEGISFLVSISHELSAFPIEQICLVGISMATLLVSDSDIVFSGDSRGCGGGPQRVLTIRPRLKKFGSVQIILRAYEFSNPSRYREAAFVLHVDSLKPFVEGLDDRGQRIPFPPLRTRLNQQTYPYGFLIGDEDTERVDEVLLTWASLTPSLVSTDGIVITLDNVTTIYPDGAKRRKATISVNPMVGVLGTAHLSLNASDLIAQQSGINIAFSIEPAPILDTFCSYDVQEGETLQTISSKLSIAPYFHMHWLSIYLMNNDTIAHPKHLQPGTRVSVCRPYVVHQGESLHSIANKFGTSWQSLYHFNREVLVNANQIVAGQLLCVVPDLGFIACRHRMHS